MKKTFFILIALFIGLSNLYSMTYTFTGAYNSDWNNALNWKSPAGMPGNVILKPNTVIIEATCNTSQGNTITNYGNLIVKRTCHRFTFYSINNYGKVNFEHETFIQALGSTFKNYPGAFLILPSTFIQGFCHLDNKGILLESSSLAKIDIQEFHCQ